jgi:hypothetical protein
MKGALIMCFFVYVNWESRQVVGAEEFNMLVMEKADEVELDTDRFNEWLTQNYAPSALLDMIDCEQDEVRELYRQHCEDAAQAELLTEWEESLVYDGTPTPEEEADAEMP